SATGKDLNWGSIESDLSHIKQTSFIYSRLEKSLAWPFGKADEESSYIPARNCIKFSLLSQLTVRKILK
ncbi:hypothetical protein OLZ33_22805, partial [Pantoea ananatis]|uniref:hypothetical protein n=1 Tax=Pantoea ananas TaxID=553 RepID=UPI0022229ECD